MVEKKFPSIEKFEDTKAMTFTRRIVLTILICSALLAIASLRGLNAGRKMLYAQMLLSDQSAGYQSIAMREHLYKTNGLRMEADLLERGQSMQPNIRTLYEAILKDMKAEEARYREEKKKGEEKTRQFEEQRDRNLAKQTSFVYAESLLLISIIIAAVSFIVLSRRLYYATLAFASLGALCMMNGYLLIL
jgi:hypothetical protein